MQLQAEGSFNSMKVRLKRKYAADSVVSVPCFNSMKVRLKPLNFLITKYYKISFNSMKVRLKRCTTTDRNLFCIVSIP